MYMYMSRGLYFMYVHVHTSSSKSESCIMIGVSLLVYLNGWVIGPRREGYLLGQVVHVGVTAILTQVVLLAAQIALVL